MNSVELHFATDGGSACLNESCIARILRGPGNYLELWVADSASPNELIAFAIVQIVIVSPQLIRF